MSDMRLIDADELKKAFEKPFWEKWEWEIICKYIDNAPTVDTKDIYDFGYAEGHIEGVTQSRWIPVSERLPEENVCDDGYHEPSKWVLVQARNGHMYTSRYWTRNKKNVWVDLNYPEDIVAWQPLPEPYNESGEEE